MNSDRLALFPSNVSVLMLLTPLLLILTPKVASANPIASWTFEEGAGTTTVDVTGQGHDGTLNGPVWTIGQVGNALNFDGSNDYVEIPSAPFGFSTWNAITVVAWVKNDDGVVAGTDDIISYWNYPTSKSWILTHHRNDRYFWEIAGKGNISGGTVSTNWVHVAGTYDAATGVMRLYVNGVEVASRTGLSGTLPSSNAQVRVGSQQDGSNYFGGIIDEAHIFDRALTQSEIQELMNM